MCMINRFIIEESFRNECTFVLNYLFGISDDYAYGEDGEEVKLVGCGAVGCRESAFTLAEMLSKWAVIVLDRLSRY